jgi:hypothetical protein
MKRCWLYSYIANKREVKQDGSVVNHNNVYTGLAYGVSEAEAKGLCYDLALKTLKTTDGWHNHTVFIGTEINQDVLNQIAKETGLQ